MHITRDRDEYLAAMWLNIVPGQHNSTRDRDEFVTLLCQVSKELPSRTLHITRDRDKFVTLLWQNIVPGQHNIPQLYLAYH